MQTDFFWEVRPGFILLGAAMCSLVISTFLASFWPEGDLDGLPVKGLALGDYSLMPLWIWIYCLIWWFVQVESFIAVQCSSYLTTLVQDALKVITIRTLMAMPQFRPFKVTRFY